MREEAGDRGTQARAISASVTTFFRSASRLKRMQPLPQLTLPVFIVAGQEDRLIRAFYFEAIATEIPGAQLTLIPQCGHVPQEECPIQFMEEVIKYLETQ